MIKMLSDTFHLHRRFISAAMLRSAIQQPLLIIFSLSSSPSRYRTNINTFLMFLFKARIANMKTFKYLKIKL